MDEKSFKEKLEAAHAFPTLYMFKFIVPKGKAAEVEALFPMNEVTHKPSSGGKYISSTASVMVSSADQVIEVYNKAYQIEGIISL